MKKFFIIAGALAALAIPSVASADVVRCGASSPVTTAKFTMIQPANAYGQWSNVWRHDFTVTVAADKRFSGEGVQTGTDANYPNGYTAKWAIIGKFNADQTVTFTATREDGLVLGLTNAVMDNSTITRATLSVDTAQPVEEKVSAPEFTTIPGESQNHGQFVKAQGGGKDAAQACDGMPVNSAQGKK